MLSVFLGNMDEAIYHPPTYFDNRYEEEWITDPRMKGKHRIIVQIKRNIL